MCLSTVQFQQKQKPLFLSIEGNIGAGKSTFLNILNKSLGMEFEVVPEPLEEWLNVGGKNINILDLLYKDSSRWSYTFQTFAFYSRLRTWEKIRNDMNCQLFISERSCYSDNRVFAKNFYNQGFWEEAEWACYCEWFKFLTDKLISDVDGLIYLRATPETCFGRCNKRSRNEESSIPKDYFDQLHARHEEWLVDSKEALKYPILILDTDKEFENNPEYQDEILMQVQNFIKQLLEKRQNKEEIRTNSSTNTIESQFNTQITINNQ